MFGLTTVIALICVVVGIALARMTWWFWVEARPESPALAPLEIMSESRYAQADEGKRALMLDSVRMGANIKPRTKSNSRPAKVATRTPVTEPTHTSDASKEGGTRQGIDPLLK